MHLGRGVPVSQGLPSWATATQNESMRLGVVCLGAFIGLVSGCRDAHYFTKTRLPSGYKHDGVKRVFLCAVGDSYEDQLALRAVQETIKSYPGLFAVVPSVDEAEMVLQASGIQGRAAQGGGVGVGIGPVGLSSGKGVQTPSTELSVFLSLRSSGEVVYQNLVVLPQHPNVGMPKAAVKIFAAYANGR